MKFDISILSSVEGMREDWLRLEKDASCDMFGFQSYGFTSSWMETIGRAIDAEPLLAWVRGADGRTLLLFPLAVIKKNGCKVLIFMGGRLADYFAPIVSKELANIAGKQVVAKVWEELRGQLSGIDAIHFQKMPEYIGNSVNPMLFLATSKLSFSSHFLRMPGNSNWEHYQKFNINKKVLADSRRQKRRLSEKGCVRFLVAKGGDDASLIVEAMIRQKSRRYRETGVRDIFSDDSYRQFFSLISRKYVSGLVHVSALLLDEEILACHVGLVFRNRFYYLMPSYEAGEWRKYSPGRLLLEHLLEWANDQRIECFDFTIGDEAYKKIWSTDVLDLYEYSKALTVKGYVYLGVERFKVFVQGYPLLYDSLIDLRNWMEKNKDA